MRVATRDTLAGLLLGALETRGLRTAIGFLSAYGVACRLTPENVNTTKLCPVVGEGELGFTIEELRRRGLLVPVDENEVRLELGLDAEWSEIRQRLLKYDLVLGQWPRVPPWDEPERSLRKGVLLFNSHLFFEVHEVLEPQWLTRKGREKEFLQGLIQIAVAFHHLERENVEGARSLLGEGLSKTRRYAPSFLRVEVQKFSARLEECESLLLKKSDKNVRKSVLALIPKMELV